MSISIFAQSYIDKILLVRYNIIGVSMALSKHKLRILDQVKQNETEFEQFIQDCLSKGECLYDDIVTYNAHATGTIDIEKLALLASQLVQRQNNTEAVWAQLSGNQPAFYHFDGTKTAKTKAGDIECRFYLNLKAKYMVAFAQEFVAKCEKRHLPYRFKIATDDVRSDDVVVYTSYENAQKFLNVINEIEIEHPQLFEGAERTGVMTGKIGKYIAFGEECLCMPGHDKTSFNKLRADTYGKYVEQIKYDTLTELFKQNKEVNTSKGEKLTLDEYVVGKIQDMLLRTATNKGVNIFSDKNKKLISEKLIEIYMSLIELKDDNYEFALVNNVGKEVKLQLDCRLLLDKMLSVFRINKNADKNVQKLSVAQKIIESRLPRQLVVSEGSNALTYLEKVFGQKIESVLQAEIEARDERKEPSFDYCIAQSRIKNNSNYGRLAIRKAIVHYLLNLTDEQKKGNSINVDLSATGVEFKLDFIEVQELEQEILQGFNDSVLKMHERKKDKLIPEICKENNVSALFPFINYTTEQELVKLFKKKPNLKIR